MAIRIAHVTNEGFGLDTANGVQHVVYCLAHAQAEIGESVAVFTRDDNAVHFLGGGVESTPRRSRMVCGGSGKSVPQGLLSRHLVEPALAEDVIAWQPDIV